jgi:hypothetical protein
VRGRCRALERISVNHDQAGSPHLGRRSLLGRTAGLAVVGAATTAATAGVASARGARPAAGDPPTDADVELLGVAQQFELAALELYEAALQLTWTDEAVAAVVLTFRDSHEAYAASLSGLLGRRAPNTANEELFEELIDGFSADTDEALAAMYQLEADLAATHTDVSALLATKRAASLVASIAMAEARHGTVLADVTGQSDLDSLLVAGVGNSLVGAEG